MKQEISGSFKVGQQVRENEEKWWVAKSSGSQTGGRGPLGGPKMDPGDHRF